MNLCVGACLHPALLRPGFYDLVRGVGVTKWKGKPVEDVVPTASEIELKRGSDARVTKRVVRRQAREDRRRDQGEPDHPHPKRVQRRRRRK